MSSDHIYVRARARILTLKILSVKMRTEMSSGDYFTCQALLRSRERKSVAASCAGRTNVTSGRCADVEERRKLSCCSVLTPNILIFGT